MGDHPRDVILLELEAERHRQDAMWGQQNHPDGTGPQKSSLERLERVRQSVKDLFGAGLGSWRWILDEEVNEAFVEDDPVKLREELIQVAAVAVAWVEAIDRRPS